MSEAEKFAVTLREESLRRVDDRYVHHAIIRTEMRGMADRIERWERMDFRPRTRAEPLPIADTVLEILAADWRLLKDHHPVGAYLPVGQLDGDCSCGRGAWPCEAVRNAVRSGL